MTDDVPTQLQSAGRYLFEHGLAWGNAGNMSARSAPGRCLITASGTQLNELGDGDLVDCALEEGATERHTRRPSKELPLHRAVYAVRPEVSAVLHASPFYTTLAACSAMEIPSGLFVEAMYYLERVARVPYAHPGSAALAKAVRARARDANVLLLENHGVLVYDTSVREALVGLHTLELACRMLLTARGAGIELKMLAPAVVSDFLERSGYRPRREWPR